MSARQHRVMLFRVECDTALDEYEVADVVAWHLGLPPYDGNEPFSADPSAVTFTRAVVTRAREVE